MSRLIRQLHLPEEDMFKSRGEILDEAYRLQGERIAYTEEVPDDPGEVRSAAG
jgi:hypothetical protein